MYSSGYAEYIAHIFHVVDASYWTVEQALQDCASASYRGFLSEDDNIELVLLNIEVASHTIDAIYSKLPKQTMRHRMIV